MQSGDILALLPKELDRIIVIERYKKGDITQSEASRILGLSIRPVYDYGLTLAAEKLAEYFNTTMSKETVRKLTIEAEY